MKLRSAFFASAFLGLASMTATAGIGQSSAAQTDWTKRVTLSAQGGHVLGNPLARHQLTEYMSYTCNHCANFDSQAHLAIKNDFVRQGHVSFEIRNLVLNPIDFTAAILARCGGRTKFFGNHRAILTQQTSWLTRFQSSPPEVMQSLNKGDINSRLQKIARAADFYGLMKKRGYSEKQLNACLTDKKIQDKIIGMTRYATQDLKLTGTPSFTLNDKPIAKVHSWTQLKPILTGLPD